MCGSGLVTRQYETIGLLNLAVLAVGITKQLELLNIAVLAVGIIGSIFLWNWDCRNKGCMSGSGSVTRQYETIGLIKSSSTSCWHY